MKNNQETSFFKPITSFLKDSLPLPICPYSDKVTEEFTSFIKPKGAPSSVTRLIPSFDENALRNQQRAMIGLSDQIRQLKVNNEGLIKDNFLMEKELLTYNSKLSYYEEVILKLYNPNSSLKGNKHEIDSMIEGIIKKKQAFPLETTKKQASLIPFEVIEKKTKDIMVQVDLSPINLEVPLYKAEESPINKADSKKSSPIKEKKPALSSKQEKAFNEFLTKESEERIFSFREAISGSLQRLENVSKEVNIRDIDLVLSFPFYLEDNLEDIVQFKDIELYNLNSNLSLWSLLYRGIELFLTVFRAIFEFKWFQMIKDSIKTISLSNEELFHKYNKILGLKLEDKGVNRTKEQFIAFLSLYNDIPGIDNKLIEENKEEKGFSDDISKGIFSKRKIRKLRAKVVNLETKFLIYLINDLLSPFTRVFQLYFTKNRALYLFFQFKTTKENIINYFLRNPELPFSLNEELIDLLKLEPVDRNGVPISLKIRLNQMSFEEAHHININKIAPSYNNEPFLEPDQSKKPPLESKPPVFDLESIKSRSEAFYKQKKAFVLRNWTKIQNILDFSRYLLLKKDELIITRKYRLTPLEIDFYERYIEKFSFYISNKVLLNYGTNEWSLFEMNPEDPSLLKCLKTTDFKEMALVLKKSLETAQESSLYLNYWDKKGLIPGKIWTLGNDPLLPMDFFCKYLILPEVLSQKSLHSIGNYYNISKEEGSPLFLLYEGFKIQRSLGVKLQDFLDFNRIKGYNGLFDCYGFNIYKGALFQFYLLDFSPTKRLYGFYEGVREYLGDKNTLIIALCDFLVIRNKWILVPGIVNFIIMSYYERDSSEYKGIIGAYSFLMIFFYIFVIKTSLKDLMELKAKLGLILYKAIGQKNPNFSDITEETLVYKVRNRTFCNRLLFIMKKGFFLMKNLCYFFLLVAIKGYISYGFSLLKIKWVKEGTLADYNPLFDINQFIPDLIDFLILPLFLIYYKKLLLEARIIDYYQVNEAKTKDFILFLYRISLEFNTFLQMIFIYPFISNCVNDNCLSMVQQSYKNSLILYSLYKISYYAFCLIKGRRFDNLRESLEGTLLSHKALNASISKNPDLPLISPIIKQEVNYESPNKTNKYLHVSGLTNNIVLYSKLDSSFYKGGFLEKDYEIIIDLMCLTLYQIGFSSLFSLDGILYLFLMFLESYFVKYRLIYLYKSSFISNRKGISHWKWSFFVVLAIGTVINIGLLAFLYKVFEGFNEITAFFIVIGVLLLFEFGILIIKEDFYKRTRNDIMNKREVFKNLMGFIN